MRLQAADGSTWKVSRYALRRFPSMDGSAAKVAARPVEGGPPGSIFDQGVRGEALGWLLPIELLSAVIARAAALLIAPLDLVLCLSGRRPWPVTARRVGVRRGHTWLAWGWAESSAQVREVRSALRFGRRLPQERDRRPPPSRRL